MLPILFRVTRGEKGLAKALEELCAHGAPHDRGRGGQHPHPLRPRREPRIRRRSRRCWRSPACIITSSARARARASASCWRPASRARCITSRCSSATAAARSIPYLAFETLDDMIREGMLPNVDHKTAVQELRQGRHQGRRQGDVEDGHLDDPELSRRADLRGRRPAARTSSTSTSPGPPRASAASASTSSPQEVLLRHQRGLPGSRTSTATRSTPAASTSGAATASTTSSTRRSIHQLQNAVRTGNYEIFKEYAQLVNDQAQAACARCAACSTSSRPHADADRGSRVGRGDRASASRPARCPTARSARKRTRRWPSP